MVSTWVVARAAIMTVVMGWVFLGSARGEAYFQDGFGTFSGWTYTSGSTGTFGASGYLYLSTGQASTGSTAAQKLLDVSLSATNDFTFTVRLASGADTSDTCGTFSAKLIDASNTVVALIDWHDVLTSTGYGGVDFYGQNKTAIYRTDPSGSGREYAVFPATGDYGSLMLMRSGCEWSAWVNGTQKGSTLTLAPTLTATKIEIEVGHWQLWGERDLAVDNIAVTPEPATLSLLALGGLALLRWQRAGSAQALPRRGG